MDVADRAAIVTEAWLDTVRGRFRRDAALGGGVLIGPRCCADCGEPIPDGRMRAMRAPERCVECQEGVECRTRRR